MTNKTIQTPEVCASDVIAFALHDGVEATLAAFPGVDEHRDVLHALVDADAELTALEHKAKEAQSRLDAADQELCLLLSGQNCDNQGETKKCLLGHEVQS